MTHNFNISKYLLVTQIQKEFLKNEILEAE